jgi:hypothetical protein
VGISAFSFTDIETPNWTKFLKRYANKVMKQLQLNDGTMNGRQGQPAARSSQALFGGIDRAHLNDLLL